MLYKNDRFESKNVEQEYLGNNKKVNQMEPMVSVHVMTYNHVQYIEQCLDSILNQETTFPFEILLGEDESTDGTRELCKKIADENQGVIRLFLRSSEDKIFIDGTKTGKFNNAAGLIAARGKYIAMCEGDDYWTDPYKLQKQFDFLESQPECVLCHHWQIHAVPDASGNYTEEKAPKEGVGYSPQTIATLSDVFANKVRIKTRTNFF